jgi:hypothetical protein
VEERRSPTSVEEVSMARQDASGDRGSVRSVGTWRGASLKRDSVSQRSPHAYAGSML